MARKITDKPNAIGVSGTYPYGDVKDNSGSGDGMPVNRLVYSDFHQFFARMADLAGIVLNSLPDNAVNGWQFVTALQTLIANAVSGEASIRSAADTTLQNNINSEAATRLAVDNAIKAITLTAGAGLSGGGDLTANRNFDVNVDGATLEINADIVRVKDSGITNQKLGTASVSSSKIADGAAIKINVSSPPLSVAVFSITGWNMDTTDTATVAHGLDWTKIRSVSVILTDNGGSPNVFSGLYNSSNPPGANHWETWHVVSLIQFNSTLIILNRMTGSFYDSAGYNNASAKITVIYEV